MLAPHVEHTVRTFGFLVRLIELLAGDEPHDSGLINAAAAAGPDPIQNTAEHEGQNDGDQGDAELGGVHGQSERAEDVQQPACFQPPLTASREV